MLDLSLSPLPAPTDPHPATLALLVAAASYTEATAAEGTDRATIEAIVLAQHELRTVAQAWIDQGRPDTWREDLPPLTRSVLVAAALSVIMRGADKTAEVLSLVLTAWERVGFPGLPAAAEA